MHLGPQLVARLLEQRLSLRQLLLPIAAPGRATDARESGAESGPERGVQRAPTTGGRCGGAGGRGGWRGRGGEGGEGRAGLLLLELFLGRRYVSSHAAAAVRGRAGKGSGGPACGARWRVPPPPPPPPRAALAGSSRAEQTSPCSPRSLPPSASGAPASAPCRASAAPARPGSCTRVRRPSTCRCAEQRALLLGFGASGTVDPRARRRASGRAARPIARRTSGGTWQCAPSPAYTGLRRGRGHVQARGLEPQPAASSTCCPSMPGAVFMRSPSPTRRLGGCLGSAGAAGAGAAPCEPDEEVRRGVGCRDVLPLGAPARDMAWQVVGRRRRGRWAAGANRHSARRGFRAGGPPWC